MELPTPSENQPDQPSSSSRLVTLKYVLWESAVSHISVFSKGNHKLGGKNTELIDLLHFLIVCVVHKYLFSHGAGSRSWEALAGDDRCHCILALCARPHASTGATRQCLPKNSQPVPCTAAIISPARTDKSWIVRLFCGSCLWAAIRRWALWIFTDFPLKAFRTFIG